MSVDADPAGPSNGNAKGRTLVLRVGDAGAAVDVHGAQALLAGLECYLEQEELEGTGQ